MASDQGMEVRKLRLAHIWNIYHSVPFALDCIDLLKEIVLNSSELQVFYPLIQYYSVVSELGAERAGELVWCQVRLKNYFPGSHNGCCPL